MVCPPPRQDNLLTGEGVFLLLYVVATSTISSSEHLLHHHIPKKKKVAEPDPGWVKYQDSDTGYRSGMNIPDHNSESLVTIFWVKNT
jgi:hypothetical protein